MTALTKNQLEELNYIVRKIAVAENHRGYFSNKCPEKEVSCDKAWDEYGEWIKKRLDELA